MSRIPAVKVWTVTTVAGGKYEILAPTRFLARLNFRQQYGYASIKSIGLRRKQNA